jgi:DNA-binding beta-propeller fold protein YncE
MNFAHRLLKVCLLIIVALASVPAARGDTTEYQVVKTIPIGGGGRWDYATIDSAGKYLYLPRSTHTDVIDTSTGALAADIQGGTGLHGVALVPDQNRGFISDGKGGAVIIFDLKTNGVLGTLPAADDADGIIYDPASAHVFIACGDSAELVPVAANIDPTAGKPDPGIDLGGKPEFLASDGEGKLYVCINDQNQIAVVDTKAMKVITKYPTDPGTKPTGLCIDPDKGRLYIGCRNQKLIVMDTKDGTVLADLAIGKGVDATKFYAGTGTAFASCGDGTLFAVRETSPGKFEIVQTITTPIGARTMAIDPTTGTIYLPTADMQATTLPSGAPGKPKPIAGTFKVFVVAPASK